MAITARTEFAAALNQLASEKGVDPQTVIQAIEQAALAAYRKDLSLRGEVVPEDLSEYSAKVDPVTGGISIYKGDKDITPPGFARIAAQTAKQVIMQRLHEAEKSAILDEYEKKVGTVVSGVIQRQEGSTYFIDLGRAEGVFPLSEQIRGEYYYPHQRLKFFIKEIRDGRRGPEVVVSRTDPGLIKGLFATEVPEIQTGSVIIKEITREPGSRTKVAVASTQSGVDPVGSLVGQKGVRVQAVMNEIGEERIDIVPFSEDLARFVAAALSPAKDIQVKIEEENGEKVAKVTVPENQLSLAIGRGGQNARLAAKLTGCKIDISGTGEEKEIAVEATPSGVTVAQDQPSGQAVADIVEDAQESLEVGEQPLPTDETALKEGRQSAVEGIESEIDKATEELAGTIQPEDDSDKAAIAQAEADIEASEDQAKQKDPDLGSMAETPEQERGPLVADHVPTEDESPTVAETTDMKEEQELEASMLEEDEKEKLGLADKKSDQDESEDDTSKSK